MTYKIFGSTKEGSYSIDSAAVLSALRLVGDNEADRYIAAIEEIERAGIRYSNQDFDLLSGGAAHARKSGANPEKCFY